MWNATYIQYGNISIYVNASVYICITVMLESSKLIWSLLTYVRDLSVGQHTFLAFGSLSGLENRASPQKTKYKTEVFAHTKPHFFGTTYKTSLPFFC